ncbi:kidney mitochondrial carrier protein 1-like [Mya arenaria]|uniref:kidney mitochondrial carrier protein 1-like n=1 Tax=Mya arenaria TaxID=6604 RepID=UPI0022E86694|nr:kidney mitochondrial carrier protein 1-like [Mya arenaria]XP_052783693.1 kidney mitochondrial carrier protein 1-like [Mya arenaria]
MGQRKISWEPFVYGGLASVTAECGTFPIDTTKTRLQIQGQRIDAKLSQVKYNGMIHALLRIFKEEGLTALYSGIAPALLRQASYGTVKIGVYHYMNRMFAENEQEESLPVNVFCGIVAGIVSSSFANPTDVLKVRMQARSSLSGKETMVRAFHDIFRQEGVRGLWRGVGPTAQRAAIVVGVELPAYDMIKKYIINHHIMGDTKETHFVSSFTAGLAGAIASTPVDVVKTRLMNQRNLKSSVVIAEGGAMPAIYTSSMDCLLTTVKTEGVTALYKGFIPNWLRLGPWNIIFFMTYEQLKKMGC